jgi:hypothetical protein
MQVSFTHLFMWKSKIEFNGVANRERRDSKFFYNRLCAGDTSLEPRGDPATGENQ